MAVLLETAWPPSPGHWLNSWTPSPFPDMALFMGMACFLIWHVWGAYLLSWETYSRHLQLPQQLFQACYLPFPDRHGTDRQAPQPRLNCPSISPFFMAPKQDRQARLSKNPYSGGEGKEKGQGTGWRTWHGRSSPT